MNTKKDKFGISGDNHETGHNNKNTKRKLKIIVVTSAAVLLTAALAAVILVKLYKNGVFIPKYATWNEYEKSCDMNGEQIVVKLHNRKLVIEDTDDNVIYKPKKGVFVSDVFCVDIDHDDDKEVVIMAWKQGSFGKHKPFWIKEDTKKFTQHIYLYEWEKEKEDRLYPKWMSSKLAINVSKIEIDDKAYIHLTDENGEETVWAWLSWGLVSVD